MSMDLGEAIRSMKKGLRVRRNGWNGKGMWLCIMPAFVVPADMVNGRTRKFVPTGDLRCDGYIVMWTAQGTWQPGWTASQADMLAEDWEVVESAAPETDVASPSLRVRCESTHPKHPSIRCVLVAGHIIEHEARSGHVPIRWIDHTTPCNERSDLGSFFCNLPKGHPGGHCWPMSTEAAPIPPILVNPPDQCCVKGSVSGRTMMCELRTGHEGDHAVGSIRWPQRELVAQCGVRSPKGAVCALPKGHPGAHHDHVEGVTTASWR